MPDPFAPLAILPLHKEFGSTAPPCGHNQNNKNQDPSLVDDLCVETLCLYGGGELVQKGLLKKQEITVLQCRAHGPAPFTGFRAGSAGLLAVRVLAAPQTG
jgi:hypothetical protein